MFCGSMHVSDVTVTSGQVSLALAGVPKSKMNYFSNQFYMRAVKVESVTFCDKLLG